MNCRDCLHFKACYEMATANNADEFNTMFAENCEDFSDRSREEAVKALERKKRK